jgi:hypothetical protein
VSYGRADSAYAKNRCGLPPRRGPGHLVRLRYSQRGPVTSHHPSERVGVRPQRLAWETAYAKSYQIQVSPDGINWTNLYTTTTGDGGFDDLDVNGAGRYVPLTGAVRATGYGYSLWEFGIYH